MNFIQFNINVSNLLEYKFSLTVKVYIYPIIISKRKIP